MIFEQSKCWNSRGYARICDQEIKGESIWPKEVIKKFKIRFHSIYQNIEFIIFKELYNKCTCHSIYYSLKGVSSQYWSFKNGHGQRKY